jgi:hypothetical protein
VAGMHLVAIHQIVPLLSLTGVVLNALGGLYLAYDLFGAKQGPLRMLSRLFTYSAIFGLGYAAMLGLWFGLAGAFVMGPLMEYQLWRRARGVPPSNLEWLAMATLRGFAFGAAGWLAVGRDFGLAFGVLSAIAMHLSYASGFGMNEYRIYQRPRIERTTVQGSLVRGVLIGLDGIQIGFVVGVLNTTVTVLSPVVEWWVDNLPDRALGGYGAFLLLIGSAMQTVQYVIPLISR